MVAVCLIKFLGKRSKCCLFHKINGNAFSIVGVVTSLATTTSKLCEFCFAVGTNRIPPPK